MEGKCIEQKRRTFEASAKQLCHVLKVSVKVTLVFFLEIFIFCVSIDRLHRVVRHVLVNLAKKSSLIN